jgi:flagellin-like protein
MNIKDILKDQSAVSPVIGVILMVAITVILAAVIGTFVLGLGDQVQTTSPSASFNFDYDGASNGTLQVTHNGGDTIRSNQVQIKASQNIHAGNGSAPVRSFWNWNEFTRSGSEISAGNYVSVTGQSTDSLDDATVRVVWTGESGDQSATLGKWSGPNA